ncbi:MAG: alpha-hydroxy-acid oxidizing protein [Firmicutes bacterium]|nr:alpha-hydroxy-acid oxidizing protein [Bacillota bacterium]
MKLRDVRTRARERLRGFCRVCRICDGRACAGEMPGMGGRGTGAGFINNVEALARVRLNMTTIHSATEPDLTYDFFGQKLSFPVLGAPLGGAEINLGGALTEGEFADAQVRGAVEAGTIAWTGDGPDPILYQSGLKAIRAQGGRGVPVIKPRKIRDIMQLIRQAEEHDVLAVGIDIDAAGFRNMDKAGEFVGPKSVAQLKGIIGGTKLAVILKGIMTRGDALAALETGAAGIVVSNHGGRALDHTPGTIEVLPEIAAVIRGRLRVFLDGGIRTGDDVLKAIALGAEAVLVGRPIAIAAFGGGTQGVRRQLEQFKKDLKTAMIMTGCDNLQKIGPAVVRPPRGW